MQPPILSWQQILRHNFTDLNKLADYLQLSESQRQALNWNPRFPLNLPMRLASKMAKGDLEDPIFKQFVPTKEEEKHLPNFVEDPVGDQSCRKAPKLLHKYQGRVLLLGTSACAMHCRFCFRQHFDYEITDKRFEEELLLIEKEPSINEVILSGGDPLSLSNRMLASILKRLEEIAHVRKVRFHTRFPIGIPERIDHGLLDLLAKTRLQFWFIVHVNHPRELDEDVLNALKAMHKLGIPILNQCVLLRGVNDSVEVLYALCQTLVDHGIFPYYLHQLDRVQSASHFEVPEEQGRALIQALSAKLPGYAVPKYVREVPGMPGKSLI